MTTPLERYGRDTLCTTSLITGRFVAGVEHVAHRIARRITSPPGCLPEDRSYGFDVRSLLNGDFTAGEVALQGQRVRAEVLQDNAVSTCEAEIIVTVVGPAMELLVSLAIVLKGGEPLRMTMSVSRATAELLEVSS
jgi:hypothetical protein